MEAQDVHKNYARYNEAKQFKGRWLSIYKDLYLYVIPDRDAFDILFNYRDDGKPTTQMVWDNTAVLAAYQRANDLHGLLLPQDRVWGKLILDPHIYSDSAIRQNQPYIDQMNDLAFFYLNQSNLSRVVSSSNLDLVGGTAAIWVESISDRVPLYFRSVPAVAVFVEYSTDDVMTTAWYASRQSGRRVLETFPKYNGDRRKTLEEQLNQTFTVNYGQIQVDEDLFYIYAFLEDDPFHLLFERWSKHQQLIIYRDRVRPGEAEGRGVGSDLLPTIKDLNRMVADNRKSIAFKANPPMFYDADKYFNPYSVRQWAGAMIARKPGSRNPLEALEMPQSPEVFQQILHLQDVIQKGFMVDPLGEIESPVKSATEISIRENRAQRTSATDISRLINELPRQIYEVSTKILNERGLLLKNRRSIPSLSKMNLKFEYTSPLYDLQKQEDLNHLQTDLQLKQQYFGEGAALATMDIGETSLFLQDKLNLPSKLFKTKEQIEAFLKALAEQAQNAAQPKPSTTAAPIQVQQPTGVTI